MDPLPWGDISAREAEVLAAVGRHLTNAQIAGRLHISARTVESRVSALLRECGASDRRHLAVLAAEGGRTRCAGRRRGAAGGPDRFDLDAAAAVSPRERPSTVAHLLGRLVEKSLVVRRGSDSTRYRCWRRSVEEPDPVAHRLGRALAHLTFARGSFVESRAHYRAAAERATTPADAVRDLRGVSEAAQSLADGDDAFDLLLGDFRHAVPSARRAELLTRAVRAPVADPEHAAVLATSRAWQAGADPAVAIEMFDLFHSVSTTGSGGPARWSSRATPIHVRGASRPRRPSSRPGRASTPDT